MRATQVVGRGEVKIVDAPAPTLKPGCALVRTMLLSLCGSDVGFLHHLDHHYPCEVGTTGHEMVGLIEAVDAPGHDIGVGDVALVLVQGHHAMAEWFLAPAEDVLVLPSDWPLEQLLMAQQLGTVIFACKRLPNIIGKDVAIIGQGSAGLFFDSVCRRMGANRVIGLDVKAARVAAGARFGATHAVNVAQDDPLEAVEDITQGHLADVVVEAAGEEDTIRLTPRLVKVGGHLLFFGIPRVQSLQFDYSAFFRKYCYTTSISGAALEPGRTSSKMALDLIVRGEIDVSSMITHRFPFERVLEAYELARTRDDGVIKVVIQMPGLDCAASPSSTEP